MISAVARLDAASEEQLGALLRGLRRLQGFGLYEVVADGAARAELLRRLSDWADAGLVQPLHEVAAGADGVREVLQIVAAIGKGPAATGLIIPHETLLQDDCAVLRALHLVRDRLPEVVAGPVIFVVAAERQADVAHGAPDLMRVRRSTYALNAESFDTRGLAIEREFASPEGRRGDAQVLAELHQRDQAYRALAADIEPSAGPGLVSRWALLADAFLDHFDPAAALAAARDAAKLAEQLGYLTGLADANYVLAKVHVGLGHREAALALLRDVVVPANRQLGKEGNAAVAYGLMADVLQAQGQLDEALRIRREEELPVHERLGDVREKALAMGKIADVLQARGQLDEALRIRREEELPVYERLGDVHAKAVTMGQIADVLQARGQLDEALRIRREEELPVYERLGDVHAKAATMGRIANVLQSQGQLDEALRIHREEQLPVYERLGDVHGLLTCRTNLAHCLAKRGRPEDRAEIRALLQQAHAEAQRLQLPEAQQIAALFRTLFGTEIASALDPPTP